MFASYNACFTDLKPFLEELDDESASAFIAQVYQEEKFENAIAKVGQVQ